MSVITLTIIVVIYLSVIGYLGFRGFMGTRSSADYMLAGRKTHPYIMALSYGATFISTSAIVGFGGAAALFGMGLLWLTFLNIFVGIFIAFVVFGRPTRRMGHHLDAHTFPELLGRRFNSRFIQGAAGLIILLFMPLYACAVLIGAAQFISGTFHIDYDVAVAIFSIIIAGYVVAGGLKGVMYTDALQGSLMFIGMVALLIFCYARLGGVVDAHQRLSKLPETIDARYEQILPDVRAAAPIGTPDDQLIAWVAEQAGRLGAAKTQTAGMDEDAAAAHMSGFFEQNPQARAAAGLLKNHPVLISKLITGGISKAGWQGWTRMPKAGSNFWYVLVTSLILGVGIGVLAQPQLAVRFMTVKSTRELNRAILVGGIFILAMTGVAFIVGNLSNVWFFENADGHIAYGIADKNVDRVVPEFIGRALPAWFGALFMLTLLSAAMSTLSSQFHAMGTSIGRDFFERGLMGTAEHKSTVLITRIGIVLAMIATIVMAYELPVGIVAAATAIFFGLCGAAFLPMFIGALFWRRMTRAGAIASLLVGFGISFFWLMFVQNVKGKLPAVFSQVFFDQPTLLPEPIGGIHWNWLEALVVALPLSALVAVVVSLVTKPEPAEHLDRCYNRNG